MISENMFSYSSFWIDKVKLLGVSTFVFLLIALPIYAQNSTDMNQNLISPPFIAKTSNFMAMAFQVEAVEAQKLLPEGVLVVPNEEGFATGSLEIYKTDQAYGIPNYTIAFFTIAVKSEASDNGKEGNFPVWGVIDSPGALASFQHYFNFPYSVVDKILLEGSDSGLTSKIEVKGNMILSLSLKKDPAKPVKAEGLAVILSKSQAGELLSVEIPWLAEGNQTDIVKLEVNAADSNPLSILSKAKPFYSQMSSNVFSYSKPMK